MSLQKKDERRCDELLVLSFHTNLCLPSYSDSVTSLVRVASLGARDRRDPDVTLLELSNGPGLGHARPVDVAHLAADHHLRVGEDGGGAAERRSGEERGRCEERGELHRWYGKGKVSSVGRDRIDKVV